MPAPLATISEGVVWLPEDAQVRAGTSSFVRRLEVVSGSEVRPGDALVQLSEPAFAAQLLAQSQRVAAVETRLRAEEVGDRAKAAVTRQELEAERSELQRLSSRSQRLVVRSARAGKFIALNPSDLEGRWVKEGTMVGFIVSNEPRIVRAVVRQDNIELVRNHLRAVDAKIADRISDAFKASIVREVPTALNALPSKALGVSGGGRLRTIRATLKAIPPSNGFSSSTSVFHQRRRICATAPGCTCASITIGRRWACNGIAAPDNCCCPTSMREVALRPWLTPELVTAPAFERHRTEIKWWDQACYSAVEPLRQRWIARSLQQVDIATMVDAHDPDLAALDDGGLRAGPIACVPNWWRVDLPPISSRIALP